MRPESGRQLFYDGEEGLLDLPCVAIVGSRAATELGLSRARRLARELARAGVVVVSGLAVGIDAAAHREAMFVGGRTVGVIGTPLNEVYPASHAELQARIAALHLLVSPFAEGKPRRGGNFPARNRIMAELCDATVVVEASEKSGTRHQAEAAERLGRPLFFCASLANDPRVDWVRQFTGPNTHVLNSTEQILASLPPLPAPVAL